MTADNIFGALLILGIIAFLWLFAATLIKKKKWKNVFHTKHLRLVDPKEEAKF